MERMEATTRMAVEDPELHGDQGSLSAGVPHPWDAQPAGRREPDPADARRALGDAVVALERERSTFPRRTADEAIPGWEGPVDARWSLVDVIDRDGRRYILARENPVTPAPIDRLSARERQVVNYVIAGLSNKYIAYELKIAHSTVRVLIARAAAKFGVKSRTEVSRLVAAAQESGRQTI